MPKKQPTSFEIGCFLFGHKFFCFHVFYLAGNEIGKYQKIRYTMTVGIANDEKKQVSINTCYIGTL